MNKSKRILSAFLSFLILLTTFPQMVFAEQETEKKPVVSMIVTDYKTNFDYGFNNLNCIRTLKTDSSAKAGETIAVAFSIFNVKKLGVIEFRGKWNTEYLIPGKMNASNKWDDISGAYDAGAIKVQDGYTTYGSYTNASNGDIYLTADGEGIDATTTTFECYDGENEAGNYIVNGAVPVIVGFRVLKDIDNIYDMFTFASEDVDSTHIFFDYNNDEKHSNVEGYPTGSPIADVSIAKSEWCSHNLNTTKRTDCTKDLICSICGGIVTPAGEHDYTDVVTKPTCTTIGYTTHTCKTCGTVTVDSEVNELGHDWDDGLITKPVSCTEDGVRTYTCKRDSSHTKEEPIVHEGHDYKQVVTAPTCTTDGYTTYTCSKCSDNYRDNYVDALGHDLDDGVVTKEATCTENGTLLKSCKRENCNYTEISDIEALGHDYKDVVTAPTCTEDGYTTHTCTRCNESYRDTEVAATGHKWDNGVVTKDSTCDGAGVKTYTCTVCGETKTEAVSPKGHTVGDWEVATPATCTVDGEKVKKCTTCGAIIERETIEATGHTIVTDNAVAPTCTVTGLTEGSHCSVCNTVIKAQETVPATGHTIVIDKEVPATCTSTGLSEGSHCSVCNTIIKAQVVTNKINHDYYYVANADGISHVKKCHNCDEINETEECDFEGGICGKCGNKNTATAPTSTIDNISAKYGEAITIEPKFDKINGQTYSYEWFLNDEKQEATTESISIDSLNVGTTKVYCVITATRDDNKEKASNASNIATITIGYNDKQQAVIDDIKNIPDKDDKDYVSAIDKTIDDYNKLDDNEKSQLDDETKKGVDKIQGIKEIIDKVNNLPDPAKDPDKYKEAIEDIKKRMDDLGLKKDDLPSDIADKIESGEKIKDILDDFNKLPDKNDPDYEDKMKDIINKYDNLTDKEKDNLPEDVKNAIEEAKKINALTDSLSKLPSPSDFKKYVEALREIIKNYNNLTEKQKQDLSDSDKKTVEHAFKIVGLVDDIAAVPSSPNDSNYINALKVITTDYSNLTDFDKSVLPADYVNTIQIASKILDLVDKANSLPDPSKDSNAYINALKELIDKYNSLTSDEKSKVPQSVLDIINNGQKTLDIINKANSFDPGKSGSADDLKDLVDSFDKLTDKEKEQLPQDVKNKVEAAKKILEIIDLIKSLPDPSKDFEKYVDALKEILNKYNKLTDEEKTLIPNETMKVIKSAQRIVDVMDDIDALENFEGDDITDLVKKLVDDYNKLTDEEKALIPASKMEIIKEAIAYLKASGQPNKNVDKDKSDDVKVADEGKNSAKTGDQYREQLILMTISATMIMATLIVKRKKEMV